MDRLSAVIDRLALVLVLLAAVGCEEKPTGGEPPSRVNGAKTTKRQGATVEAFCDVYTPPESAKPMPWPAMTDAAPKASTGWRWVNIWATWCKPCVDEMPRIAKWKTKLGVDVTFVSVDESADDITTHKQAHPDMPATLRLADAKTQDTWLHQLGVSDPRLPIHVFVDAQQRVRCIRSGSVNDGDLAIVEKLLAR